MKYHQTVLEIDLNALTHNYNFLRSKCAPKVKLMAVVKAFAYGSDAVQVAQHLVSLGVDYFAVAYTPEGIELREAGIKTPILVLHPQPVNFQDLRTYDLEPSLYNLYILKEYLGFLSELERDDKNKIKAAVHLKFNTGLNRIGFSFQDIPELISVLKNQYQLRVLSILSHLAASEDLTELEFTTKQIADFKQDISSLAKALPNKPLIHQCNTSGILNYPEAHFDMVRTGIGLYGYGNDPKYDIDLKPVVSLKSVISQINILENGESLGYNRAFIAKRRTKAATIPIGHADGITRQYGNQNGFVYINNCKAYIIGNVCMDMIMVDITNISCKIGDQVILFDNNHTADTLARAAGTISYELITGISRRVPRKIIL